MKKIQTDPVFYIWVLILVMIGNSCLIIFWKASKNGHKDILDISINAGGNLLDKDNHGSPVLNFG
jgi:hypothetical protein